MSGYPSKKPEGPAKVENIGKMTLDKIHREIARHPEVAKSLRIWSSPIPRELAGILNNDALAAKAFAEFQFQPHKERKR
jgi:hypothetical protein